MNNVSLNFLASGINAAPKTVSFKGDDESRPGMAIARILNGYFIALSNLNEINLRDERLLSDDLDNSLASDEPFNNFIMLLKNNPTITADEIAYSLEITLGKTTKNQGTSEKNLAANKIAREIVYLVNTFQASTGNPDKDFKRFNDIKSLIDSVSKDQTGSRVSFDDRRFDNLIKALRKNPRITAHEIAIRLQEMRPPRPSD